MRSARAALGFLLLSAMASAQQYVISTIAGGVPPPTPAPGLSSTVGSVWGVAADGAGNAYIASSNLNSVFRLDPKGVLTRIAGNSRRGYSGDGGPAIGAQLSDPRGLAIDHDGNLYIADYGNANVRRVSPNGVITTVVGDGVCCYSGEGGSAVSAHLALPFGIAVDGAGNLYIMDYGAARVRKVSKSGIISTLAGNGTQGFSGDGGPATSAQLNYATGVAVDGTGNVFIADYGSHRIRKVSTDGNITTVAGNNGGAWLSGDGGPATSASLIGPLGVATDSAGNLFIADGGSVRKVSVSGIITTIANGATARTADGGSLLYQAYGVAVDGGGNAFIAATNGILKVSAGGTIGIVAGSCWYLCFSGDGGPASQAQLSESASVALDASGSVYIADAGGRIRKVAPDGAISTAVPGACVGSGDVVSYCQLAVDGAGNIYYSDDDATFKVSPNGSKAKLAESAVGLAVDGTGNLFMADRDSVRRVSPSGTTTTVLNTGSYRGAALAVDQTGNLYIADNGNKQVVKVSNTGLITTVAAASPGQPDFTYILGLAVDNSGNVFFEEGTYWVSSSAFKRVRRVSPDGTVTTIAGTGVPGYSGDGGPATNAQLGPSGSYFGNTLAIDNAGNLYVADGANNAVRILRPVSQSVLISAVLNVASERAGPISPGMIIVIRGSGLGPAQLIQNQASNGQFGTAIGETVVSFNGIPAPILYTSATQVAAVVPYSISAGTARVSVTYQGNVSSGFTVPIVPSAPGLFTSNEAGAGQAVAINTDGTVNTAANPAKIGSSILLYATGEGETAPAGVDGKLGGPTVSQPLLPVTVTVGGIKASVHSEGGAPGQVAGLMVVKVQIPAGVQPGGYVPIILQVGDTSTTPDAVWIAVSGN